MITRRSITTALTLLFAAVLSFGGPVAVHLLGDHVLAAPETHHCESSPHTHSLPAEHDTQDQDCPECDLLTTLTLADTSVGAALITANAPLESITPIDSSPAIATAHTPRTTRGPPAA